MPVGRTLGTILGGAGGFIVGGPGGAMLGAGLGGAVGGALDSRDQTGTGGGVSRNPVHYRGAGAVGEADRASQMGAEGAARSRELGRQLGADSYFGAGTANNMAGGQMVRSGAMYGAADRSMAAAGGADAMQQGARGDSMAAIGRLRGFYEQGPGPSAAEAQMRAGADSNARNAMSIARTGGGSPSAVRAALRANATAGAQTNQAAGSLRAQEEANWRQTQLAAMGAEQSGLQNVRAGDMSSMGQHIGAAGQQYGAAGNAAQTGLGYSGLGAQYIGMNAQTRMGAEGMANTQQQFGESSRQSILGTQLAADANRYGADRNVQVGMAGVQQKQDAANMAMAGSLIGTGANMYTQSQTSDVRAKENIRPTSAADIAARVGDSDGELHQAQNGQMGTLSHEEWKRQHPGDSPYFTTEASRQEYASHQDGDTTGLRPVEPASAGSLIDKLDAAYGRDSADVGPRADLRQAGSYSYEYRDPQRHGEGSHVGPMAQELERTSAAGAVGMAPDGTKTVDPGRLTMINTSAIGEQQRRLDALEAMAVDRAGGNFEPRGAQTNGQRVIRKTEAVEGRRMGGDEKRFLASFGHSGSIKPQDEEYIRETTPKRTAASGNSRRIRGERY